MDSRQNLRDIKDRNLDKYRVIVWANDGMSLHQISRNIGMDRKNIRQLLDRFDEYGTVEIDLRQYNNGKQPNWIWMPSLKWKRLFLKIPLWI